MPSSAELGPSSAGPAEEQAAEHVEAADDPQRLGAQHRVHAAERQIGRQVGGDEDELHAADEIGAGHDQEGHVGKAVRSAGRAVMSAARRPGEPAAARDRPGRRTRRRAACRAPAPAKPSTPARQPKSSASNCPIGAANSAPSDPAAVTMPSTMLRSAAGTARARPPARSPRPCRRARCRSARRRRASRRAARAPSPAAQARDIEDAPPSIIGRKPTRTASAPATGCRKPQARFCTAMASVKSET